MFCLSRSSDRNDIPTPGGVMITDKLLFPNTISSREDAIWGTRALYPM